MLYRQNVPTNQEDMGPTYVLSATRSPPRHAHASTWAICWAWRYAWHAARIVISQPQRRPPTPLANAEQRGARAGG